MNKTIGIVVGVIIVVVGGAFAVMQMNKNSAAEPVVVPTPVPVTPTPTPTPTSAPIPAPSGFTMTQVATHNSAASCWSAINGNVYDLTSWIGQHPGGPAAIKGICGIDGSAAFNGQHGGQKNPASALVNFKIGALIK